jgi:GNAT superfamily N-acetyltransferase
MQEIISEHVYFKDWTIRPPEPKDWERIAEISNLDSDEPVTGAELRRRYERFPSEGNRYYEVVTDNSDFVVGCCRAIHRPGMADGCFYCQIEIDPEFRNQGIGAFLHDRIDRFFESISAKTVTFWVRETSEISMTFASKRGYIQDRVLAESKLDLTKFDSIPFAQKIETARESGLEVVSITELGDSEETWRMIHKLLCDSDDAPDIELWGHPTFEDFYENTRHALWYVPGGLIVAKWKGEYVGFHSAGPLPDSDCWTTDYTGVIPSARRNGIALALKVEGAKVARDSGAKWILTHNDSSNEGMLSINIALGFKVQPGFAQMRKWL